MAASKIVKNPNRPKKYEKPEYEPAYKKLGLTPIVKNFGEEKEQVDHYYDNPAQKIDPSKELIDNNEYVFYEAENGDKEEHVQKQNVGEYLIFISDEFFSSGSFEEVEKKVSNLVLGEKPISIEAISVYKRINIKAGVFLDR